MLAQKITGKMGYWLLVIHEIYNSCNHIWHANYLEEICKKPNVFPIDPAHFNHFPISKIIKQGVTFALLVFKSGLQLTIKHINYQQSICRSGTSDQEKLHQVNFQKQKNDITLSL